MAVSGAASGVGYECIRRFTDEGATAVILDSDPTRGEAAAHELGADFVETDVADLAQVNRATQHVKASFGTLDVMVNNAGIALELLSVEETTPEHLRRHLDVNTVGVMNGIRSASQHLGADGAIVNTASLLGLSGLPGYPSYVATKFAVVGLTKVAAIELGPRGIRANAVCPSTVRTPMLDEFPAALQESAAYAAASSLGRILDPWEVASVIAFLASRDASGITGQAIAVDCGVSAGMSTELWSKFGGA